MNQNLTSPILSGNNDESEPLFNQDSKTHENGGGDHRRLSKDSTRLQNPNESDYNMRSRRTSRASNDIEVSGTVKPRASTLLEEDLINDDEQSRCESINQFNDCLRDLQPYLDRKGDKQNMLIALEISLLTPSSAGNSATSSSQYRTLSIRQLLTYINDQVLKIDQIFAKTQDTNSDATLEKKSMPTMSPVGYLQYRDIRRLEYGFNPHEEPSILIRRHAIVFSFTPMRAVIMHDKLLFIVPYGLPGADSLLRVLENHMTDWANWNTNRTSAPSQGQGPVGQGAPSTTDSTNFANLTTSAVGGSSMQHVSTLRESIKSAISSISTPPIPGYAAANNTNSTYAGNSRMPSTANPLLRVPSTNTAAFMNTSPLPVIDSSPFECQAYEALLATVIALQTRELDILSNEVSKILFYFRNRSIMSIEVQENIRIVKNKLSALGAKVISYKRAIVEILEDDNDLTYLNLSALKKNPDMYM